MLHVVARSGFVGFPKVALVAIAKDLGLPSVAGLDLAGVLQKLILHVIPGMGEEELLTVLQPRVKGKSDVEFLQSDEVKDLLTKDDQVEVDKENDYAQKQMCEAECIKQAVAKLRASVQAKQAAAAKAKGKGGGKKQARPEVAFQGRRYPAVVPLHDTTWSETMVNSMLPPTCRALADQNNQRWLVTFFGETRSRSFATYGHNEAARLCLELAWKVWQDQGHGPPCPIKGIMPQQ